VVREKMVYSYRWLKEYIDFDLSPEGLMELLTFSGLPIENFVSLPKDTVFECEIPANRGDLLSIFGMARELAAILRRKESLRLPPVFSEEGLNFSFKVSSSVPTLCPFYSARMIKGVKVKPSPDWLQEKLTKARLRPINNVVDITNLVLLETGQPLHAFDQRKIDGEIIVRCAAYGEKLRTLDGNFRKLNQSMLIIADQKKPLAIAGVIGGEESQVTETTCDVLLESACFSPSSIRRTTKSFNLSTESSFHFERGVDPNGVVFALNRASWLLEKECEGNVGQLNRAGNFLRGGSFLFPSCKLELRKEKVSRLLGIEISTGEIKRILTSLNFKVWENEDLFEIEIPSFRHDITEEVDLIEEVARLYGYEKIPAGIPKAKITPSSENKQEKIASRARNILVSFGLNEVVAPSFSPFSDVEEIKIANPLTVEQSVLRTNLLASLLSIFSHNVNQGNKKMGFFELGKVYLQKDNCLREKLMLSIGLYNSGNFFDLKGILEELLKRTGILGCIVKDFNHRLLEEGASAGIFVNNKLIGYFGAPKKNLTSSMKLKGEIYLAELDFELLTEFASFEKEFKPLPKYPKIKRDLSIIVDEEIDWEKISETIKDVSNLIKKVEIFDVYKGEEIPSGYRGLAISILYQSSERTLTKGEVDEVQGKVEKRLKDCYKIEVRGCLTTPKGK